MTTTTEDPSEPVLTEAEEMVLDRLTTHLMQEVRDIIDDHRVFRHLSPLTRRNMSYCAAWDAVGSLRPEDINDTTRRALASAEVEG